MLVKLGNINDVFHPAHWHSSGEIDSNTGCTYDKADKTMMSIFGNIFWIDLTESCKEQSNCFCKFLKPRIMKIFFIILVPLGIYIEFILYVSTHHSRSHIRDIVKHDILFGFTSLLGDPFNHTFIPFLGGPLAALLIFHLLGFLIVILSENFASLIAGGAKCIGLDRYIDKRAPQGCTDLVDYKKAHRIFKTGIFLLFNCRHWKNLKHETCFCSFLIKLFGVIMVLIFLFPVILFIFITSIGWIKFCH